MIKAETIAQIIEIAGIQRKKGQQRDFIDINPQAFYAPAIYSTFP